MFHSEIFVEVPEIFDNEFLILMFKTKKVEIYATLKAS